MITKFLKDLWAELFDKPDDVTLQPLRARLREEIDRKAESYLRNASPPSENAGKESTNSVEEEVKPFGETTHIEGFPVTPKVPEEAAPKVDPNWLREGVKGRIDLSDFTHVRGPERTFFMDDMPITQREFLDKQAAHEALGNKNYIPKFPHFRVPKKLAPPAAKEKKKVSKPKSRKKKK